VPIGTYRASFLGDIHLSSLLYRTVNDSGSLFFWMPNVEARAKETVKSQLQVFKNQKLGWLF
jgi:hypothetical protein